MQAVKTDTFDRPKVKYSEAGLRLKKSLDSNGVEWRKPELNDIEPLPEEIIAKLAGADKTAGSCASLAYAYAGNVCGYNVLDFRGGVSRSIFSTARDDIVKMKGVISKSEAGRGIRAAKKLLAQMEDGKEYILSTGSHAAVCRIRNGVTEFLELQSSTLNGWKPFEYDKTYSPGTYYERTVHINTSETLKDRFGCKGGKWPSYLIDISSFVWSDEFRDILGYINTAPESQQKGAGGGIK